MMEVALLLLGKMFGGKSRPKTITETVTQRSGDVAGFRAWKDAKVSEMTKFSQTYRPGTYTIGKDAKPLSTSTTIRSSGPIVKPTGTLTGSGPPMKTVVTTFKRTL